MSSHKKYARIIGTGCYVPERVMTNEELSTLVDTTDEWITKRTGIKTRHIAAENQATSDLAVEAARRALEMSGTSPEEIECIIVGTSTPDMFFPSTGCVVQHKLGATNAAAFDVSAACSGMVYSASIGNAFIQSGQYRKVLVIGADTLTKMVDFTDRNTCVLFGDGAGAFMLEASDEPGIEFVELGADGSLGDILEIPAGGSRMPATHETVDQHLHCVKANGREVFKQAVRIMEETVVETLGKCGLTSDQIDLLIPHQANLRIIDAGRQRLGLPWEKVWVNVDKYGNTTAATISIALDEAIRSGHTRKGDRVVMVSFGAGFTWAIMVATL